MRSLTNSTTHKKTPRLVPQIFSFYQLRSNVQASSNLHLGNGGWTWINTVVMVFAILGSFLDKDFIFNGMDIEISFVIFVLHYSLFLQLQLHSFTAFLTALSCLKLWQICAPGFLGFWALGLGTCVEHARLQKKSWILLMEKYVILIYYLDVLVVCFPNFMQCSPIKLFLFHGTMLVFVVNLCVLRVWKLFLQIYI